MVGLMAAALAVAVEGRWVLGAALGGFAAGVKAPGGLVCLAVVLVSLPALCSLRDRARRAVQVGAVAIGTLIGAGVLTGVGAGWVHALGVPGVVRTPLSVTTDLGLLLSWVQDGLDLPGPYAVEAVRTIGLLLALAVAAHAALRTPTGDPAAAVRSAGVVALAVVVLSPVVHPWYALWVLPFLAAAPLGLRARSTLVVLAGLLGLVAPLDSSLEARGTDIAVAVLLVVAVAATQVAGHRRALWGLAAVPARPVAAPPPMPLDRRG
jgi:hypothetical protein